MFSAKFENWNTEFFSSGMDTQAAMMNKKISNLDKSADQFSENLLTVMENLSEVRKEFQEEVNVLHEQTVKF